MNNKSTIIQVAIVLVVLYILKKILDIFSNPQTSPQGGGAQDDVVVNENNLTFDKAVYSSLADKIEAAVWGGVFSVTENDEAIFDALNQMKNLDDVKELIKIYGVRGEGILLQEYYNLPQTITLYLDDSYRNQINTLYLQRGIKYTF
jgi:hypothetical protein